jgi:hypothetical protein
MVKRRIRRVALAVLEFANEIAQAGHHVTSDSRGL